MALGFDVRQGYLFGQTQGAREVSNDPVSTGVMNNRLEKYLKCVKLFEGETIHGARAGSEITLEMLGIEAGNK